MNCSKCGTDNLPGAAFCENCGMRLATAQPAPAAQAAASPTATPAAGSNTCPQCASPYMEGERFCERCGAALTAPVATPPMPAPVARPAAPASMPPIQPPAAAPRAARLLIPSAKVEVNLLRKPELIVGRQDAGSNFFPDVDLEPYGGLDNGVSRRHACLRLTDDEWTVEDLNTTNGSSVNKQPLAPGQPRSLHHDDEVRFGNLVAIVRYG